MREISLLFVYSHSVKRGVSFTVTPPNSARYYSHADSAGKRLDLQQPQQEPSPSKDVPVHPMSVVGPPTLPSIQTM